MGEKTSNYFIISEILILIILGLLFIPLDADAYVPDYEYKDHTYSIKNSYYDLVANLRNGIITSEEVLSNSSFENTEAKRKIDTAWQIRWMAWESHGKVDSNLKQTEYYLENQNYKNSYEKLLQIDSTVYSLKDDLYAIHKEVKDAIELEKQYQEEVRTCFLFWCNEIKNTYSGVESKIKDLESKLGQIENNLSKIEANKNRVTQSIYQYEIDQKNLEIQKLEQKKYQQEKELERKQQEILKQEQIKKQQQAELERKQRELELKERQRQQEELEYQVSLEAKERQRLQELANNHPLIQQIISGKIRFYVPTLPYYAGDGVTDAVNKMFSGLDKSSGFERVYSEGQADLLFQWIKDFTPDRIGQNYKNFNQIGLGTSNCFGDWRPFDGPTVTKIIWHELGHSLGYPHNNDPNNIMYGSGTGNDFVSDYEKTTTLDEGSYQTIPFCGSGEYWYSLGSDNQYNGFQVYVITSDTNPTNFLRGEGGQHWTKCGSNGEKMKSFSGSCTVPSGAKLLIYNPDELLQTRAINIEIKIVDTDERKWPDMNFNDSELVYSKELLDYVRKLF